MSPPPARTRVPAVDAARALALLAIMSVHLLPGSLFALVSAGRSAALFVLLSGVSLSLTSVNRPPRLRTRQALRALLIILIGLVLGLSPGSIAVILAYFGVFILLALPMLYLRTSLLVILLALTTTLGPVLSYLVRGQLPFFDGSVPAPVDLGDPLELVTELTLTGYYPALPWVSFMIMGLILGRFLARAALPPREAATSLDLAALENPANPQEVTARTPSPLGRIGLVALGLGGLGVGLALLVSELFARGESFYAARLEGSFVQPSMIAEALGNSLYGTTPTTSWYWLALNTPYSGTPGDVLLSGGGALIVLGLALLVSPRVYARLPLLIALGTMTLTLYSLHVFLTTASLSEDPVSNYVTQVLMLTLFAAFYPKLSNSPRGPLEALVSKLTSGVR